MSGISRLPNFKKYCAAFLGSGRRYLTTVLSFLSNIHSSLPLNVFNFCLISLVNTIGFISRYLTLIFLPLAFHGYLFLNSAGIFEFGYSTNDVDIELKNYFASDLKTLN